MVALLFKAPACIMKTVPLEPLLLVVDLNQTSLPIILYLRVTLTMATVSSMILV